jgi:hypothetical protein
VIAYDMDEAAYHAHSALSASGAKRLLPPGCPALYRWERDHPVFRDVFDFGSAAHAVVLGAGPKIVVEDYADWRSKDARIFRDQARANGDVPLLAHEWSQIADMASAIKGHPIASALLDRHHGKPEVSLFWDDEERGIERRCRFDWLPDPSEGRLIIPDYKTATSAEPGAFSRSAASFGYHMQAAWYMDAARALELAEDVSFVFIVQEKTAPYLVTVCELDWEAIELGRRLNDRACQVFAECTGTDTWPPYSTDVELITLPRWATYQGSAA